VRMKYRLYAPKKLRNRTFREERLGENARRPDHNREIGANRSDEIRHVVVLMMENHSYDSYLGTHPRNREGDGFDLDPTSGRPLNTNLDKHGDPIVVFHRPGTVQSPGVPTQAWHPSHDQAKNSCGGFVTSTEAESATVDPSVPMSYWDRTDLPFYHGLADVFPLCTRWHCSCLGPTFPNRRFLMAGTAHGLIDDLPFAMIDYPKAGTIFDLLDAYGIRAGESCYPMHSACRF
jgi:phospholipase C